MFVYRDFRRVRLKFHKIDRRAKECYKRLWGFYTFSPCECGCTSTHGVGLELGFFGVTLSA